MAEKSKIWSFIFSIFRGCLNNDRRLGRFKRDKAGFTLIELLIILVIISILTLVSIRSWKRQLMKTRDVKRKSDLKKLQIGLDDYLNDASCYPTSIEGVCLHSIIPDLPDSYLHKTICDPLDSVNFNYFYSTTKIYKAR